MKATSFDLPSAGAILRVVVNALDLHAYADGKLDDASVRRYFRGERLTPSRRHNVHVTLARALLKAAIVPNVGALGDRQAASPGADANALGGVVDRYARVWDELVGHLRTSAPVAFPRVAAFAVLQLVAIDLAVRLAAMLWLIDWPADAALPHWPLEPNGPGDFLRAELKSAKVTRDGLASGLAVDRNTVDAWLDQSTRPQRTNIEAVAAHLADVGHGGSAHERERLRSSLARGHALRDLSLAIADAVGPDRAGDLIARAGRYAILLLVFVRRSRGSREANTSAMRDTLVAGTSTDQTPWVADMLRHLWRNEPDPTWRTALQAGGHWVEHLHKIASKLGPLSDDDRAGIARLTGRDPTHEDLERLAYLSLADQVELARDPVFAEAIAAVRSSLDGAATNIRIEAAELANRDPLAAIELHRQAIARDPLDAEAHFRLGARLGVIGDLEASLAQLRIAVGLRPDWDRPRVEIAIVLSNDGRHTDALDVLRAAERELPTVTPWVRVHIAFELEQLDRFDEAVTAYQAHLEHAPQDGEALDRLAHLLLARGDKRPGREFAKLAAEGGTSTVFDALERGFYAKPPEGRRRPPHRPGLDVHFRPFRDRA